MERKLGKTSVCCRPAFRIDTFHFWGRGGGGFFDITGDSLLCFGIVKDVNECQGDPRDQKLYNLRGWSSLGDLGPLFGPLFVWDY